MTTEELRQTILKDKSYGMKRKDIILKYQISINQYHYILATPEKKRERSLKDWEYKKRGFKKDPTKRSDYNKKIRKYRKNRYRLDDEYREKTKAYHLAYYHAHKDKDKTN